MGVGGCGRTHFEWRKNLECSSCNTEEFNNSIQYLNAKYLGAVDAGVSNSTILQFE